MFIKEDSVDDLQLAVAKHVLKHGKEVKPRKGHTLEFIGMLLELTNPRARIGRSESRGNIFSALGEFFWYLTKENRLDFIKYYIPKYEESSDDKTSVYGGYGPRLFRKDGNIDQIHNVIDLLKNSETSSSRKAVIQLFDARDILEYHADVPCTCAIQLFSRNNKLDMYVTMRSNDLFWGLSHDIFCFTMLQEILARAIGVELGSYKHAVSSMHLYLDKKKQVEQFVKEGYQEIIPMPPMPSGDQFPLINALLSHEEKIRQSGLFESSKSDLPDYWNDILRLLLIFRIGKRPGGGQAITALKKQMTSGVFNTYIDRRRRKSESMPPDK